MSMQAQAMSFFRPVDNPVTSDACGHVVARDLESVVFARELMAGWWAGLGRHLPGD